MNMNIHSFICNAVIQSYIPIGIRSKVYATYPTSEVGMKIENGMGFTLSTSLVQKVTKEQQITDESTSPSVETQIAENSANQSKSSQNLLENNFVKYDSEPSRYILGMMTALKAESGLRSKLNGIVESYKNAASAVESYAELELIGKKAAKAAVGAVQGEVAETEAQRMEEGRKEFEEQIETKLEEKAAESSEGGVTTGGSPEQQGSETVAAQNSRTVVVASEAGASQQNEDTPAATSEAASPGESSETKIKVDIVV
ncbi:MAG: hypothetical protein R6W92_05665 [Desulfocurvibacter africanus]